MTTINRTPLPAAVVSQTEEMIAGKAQAGVDQPEADQLPLSAASDTSAIGEAIRNTLRDLTRAMDKRTLLLQALPANVREQVLALLLQSAASQNLLSQGLYTLANLQKQTAQQLLDMAYSLEAAADLPDSSGDTAVLLATLSQKQSTGDAALIGKQLVMLARQLVDPTIPREAVTTALQQMIATTGVPEQPAALLPGKLPFSSIELQNSVVQSTLTEEAAAVMSAPANQSGTAVPGQPSTAVPGQPNAVVPGQPSAAVPDQPSAAVPGQPSAAVPGQPSTAMPGQPGTAVPGQPSAAVPGQPSAAVPGQPGAAVPGQPSAAVPGQPGTAVPGQPGTAVPGQPSAAVSGQPSNAMPGQTNTAVPGAPNAAVPGQQNAASNELQTTASGQAGQLSERTELVLIKQLIANLATDLPKEQIGKLVKTVENLMPQVIKQAAAEQDLPELPNLWALLKMVELDQWKTIERNERAKAGADLKKLAQSLAKEAVPQGENQSSHAVLSYTLPLYFGDNPTPYPAYIHIYHQREQNDREQGDYETWLRIALATENIGVVDTSFRLYEGEKVDIRVGLGDYEAVQSFTQAVPDIRNALEASPLTVSVLAVNKLKED